MYSVSLFGLSSYSSAVTVQKEIETHDRLQLLARAGLLDDPASANAAHIKRKRPGLSGVKDRDQLSSQSAPTTVPRNDWKSPPHHDDDEDPRPTTARGPPTKGSNHKRLSSLAQLKERRTSMFASKARGGRNERTFIGSQCAACEEPLEHTLRGERILQLTCGHVSHEACFYEYVKEFEAQTCPACEAPLGFDTSRGGGIDFENLNKLVRSVQNLDVKGREGDFRELPREQQVSTPTWETETVRQPASSPVRSRELYSARSQAYPGRQSREHLLPSQSRSSSSYRSGQHGRNESSDAGSASRADYADPPAHQQHHHTQSGRRHDYDVHSMETSLSSPRHVARNPIPAPIVTVRSEFPTLSRSRHQQSLTCLVTVEAVEGKWQPTAEDLRSPPPVPASIPEVFRNNDNNLSNGVSPNKVSHGGVPHARAVDSVHEDHLQQHAAQQQQLDEVKEELYRRCENWHGLDFSRFGRLVLHGSVRVGKDRQAWQELECYLFTEMLICVKAKKNNGTVPSTPVSQQWEGADGKTKPRVTLKGSILIKKHLKQVDVVPDFEILTLSLSVAELPHFHLLFHEHAQLEVWRRALLNINRPERIEPFPAEFDQDMSGTDEDEYATSNSRSKMNGRVSSVHSSSYGGNRSQVTAPTEYTNSRTGYDMRMGASSLHVPLDVVIVIPVSSSMQGLKINVLRDALRFLVSSLGERDRMGLVTFGSGGGGVPLVGMTDKAWAGWPQVIESIRPVGQKSMRADVVDGANVAMDLLMQRKSSNPLANILLISDSATSELESVDFVVSRAEAAKIAIHSFGLGLTHKPDTMVELSTRTKASYTYVKDWMMLRECLAGCLGSLQSTSHQNVKLKLRLPEGSPAKFVKISGALQITKRATGRDAEASLGDLRFGDKRDILIQLAIAPDTSTPDSVPSDPWENIISGLEALGGPIDQDDARNLSVEELPLIQADLSWGDILRDGNIAQLPRPSLLAITVLPPPTKKAAHGAPFARPASPPIPPHPHVVQRRMELLTSDMLSRALTLVSRGQPDRAHHLLAETRSILKGLGKGGLPPLPPPPSATLPPPPKGSAPNHSPIEPQIPLPPDSAFGLRTPSPPRSFDHNSNLASAIPPSSSTSTTPPTNTFNPATAGIDPTTMLALDSELDASLEWIAHPAVFSRDARKQVLQAIGVIASQRAYSFRSPAESLWAGRIAGVKRLSERSREWREMGDETLTEE